MVDLPTIAVPIWLWMWAAANCATLKHYNEEARKHEGAIGG